MELFAMAISSLTYFYHKMFTGIVPARVIDKEGGKEDLFGLTQNAG